MLLHKKRIEGNLMGLGFQNPYANENLLPTQVFPLNRKDYVANINLLPSDYKYGEHESKQSVFENIDSSQSSSDVQPTLNSFNDSISKKSFDVQPTLNKLDDIISKKSDLSGSGISSSTISTIYNGLKQITGAYSSTFGTKIKNFYGKRINPNPNFRTGFAGENHAILQGTVANFLGPGTHIEERIQRGDPPLDGNYGLDFQARIHDIDYMNAKNLKDVRNADKKLIKNIEKSTGSRVMKTIVKTAIQSKMKAEDLGLLDKNHFAKLEDTQLVGKGLKKTRKMGKYPDSSIRSKLLKQYAKSKKKLLTKIK